MRLPKQFHRSDVYYAWRIPVSPSWVRPFIGCGGERVPPHSTPHQD
jgi:hypothetical protein